MRYTCQQCGYKQDFKLTKENCKIHFPEMPFLKPDECPGCYNGISKGICNACGCKLDTKQVCIDCKKDFKRIGKLT